MAGIVITEEQAEGLVAALRAADQLYGGYSRNITLRKFADDVQDLLYVQTVCPDGTPLVQSLRPDGTFEGAWPGFTITSTGAPAVVRAGSENVARRILGLER